MRYPRNILKLVMVAACLGLGWADRASADVDVLPPMPETRSPIDFFRELLEMGESQRQEALIDRSPRQQQILREKLAEYEAMPVIEREARLELTELHYFLMPLLKEPGGNREIRLNAIPMGEKQQVIRRLNQWDRLTPSAQHQLLANQEVMNWFVRQDMELKLPPPLPTSPLMLPFTESQRTLSQKQAQRIEVVFRQFVDLPAVEQQRSLEGISGDLKRRILLAASELSRMPPSTRSKCISSFITIMAMSEPEQVAIMRKVAQWQSLSPDQKNALRKFVPQVPPLPPGLLPANLSLSPLR